MGRKDDKEYPPNKYLGDYSHLIDVSLVDSLGLRSAVDRVLSYYSDQDKILFVDPHCRQVA